MKKTYIKFQLIEKKFLEQDKQSRDFRKFVVEIANVHQRKNFYCACDIEIVGVRMDSIPLCDIDSEILRLVLFNNPQITYMSPIGDIGLSLQKRNSTF